MKLFIKKGFVILAFLITIDLILGFIGRTAIKTLPSKNTYLSKTTFALLKQRADILVLGSSKAMHSYNSILLSDSLGMDCYNAGEDGCDMMYMDMMLTGFLTRCRPKIIILDMATLTFGNKPDGGKLKYLYGFVKDTDHFITDNISWIERVKLHSSMYRYNGLAAQYFSTLIKGEDKLNGFSPLEGYDQSIRPVSVSHFSFNPMQLKYFDDLLCKVKMIKAKLYVFVSPSFKNDILFLPYLRRICQERGIPVNDLSTEPKFLKPELFKDDAHLNANGAELYTLEVMKFIKQN